MSVTIDNQTFYLIKEACEIAGTSRNTLLRWIRDGRFDDVEIRDRNGWRLFSQRDIERLQTETKRIRHLGKFEID